MKKLLIVLFASLFFVGAANASPQGQHPHGRTGSHYKGVYDKEPSHTQEVCNSYGFNGLNITVESIEMGIIPEPDCDDFVTIRLDNHGYGRDGYIDLDKNYEKDLVSLSKMSMLAHKKVLNISLCSYDGDNFVLSHMIIGES